jgi:phosphatidate cytidylyltransferase
MTRVLTAIPLVLAGLAAVFLLPPAYFPLVLLALGFLCWREYVAIASKLGYSLPTVLGVALGAAILTAHGERWTFLLLLAPLSLGLSLRTLDLARVLGTAAALLLGLGWIFGAWRAGLELHQLNPHWLFFALLINWVGDSGAYYAGRTFGKNKLAPRISPAKTWEGTIASLITAIAAGAAYVRWTMPELALLPVAGIALAGNAAGQLGDLCESALKRGAGIKDSGTMLPGHGGWLDRLDSALFSLPVIYVLLLLWRSI